MYKLSYVILILLIGIVVAKAQKNKNDKSVYFTYGVNLYTDALIIPDIKKDSAEVYIIFKFVYDALQFTQVNPLENPKPYRAIAESEIIFTDEQGIIRGRLHWNDTLFVDTFEETNAKDKFLFGQVSKKLVSGNYKVSVELLNKVRQDNNINNFDIKIPASQHANIYKPIFGDFKDIKQTCFTPFIWDNKINFSSKSAFAIIAISNTKLGEQFFFTLKRLESKYIDFETDSIDFTSSATVIDNKSLTFDRNTNCWNFLPSQDLQDAYLLINLPSNKFTPGKYSLTIFSENVKKEFNFNVEWIDMPYSLQDLEYSYKLLYYILTDQQYDELTSGNDKEIMHKLSDYWKSKDPTIGTPFNEAMYQYYQRADYAFFNFQTIQEKDGAKTIRGKIYILYGKPDAIKNSFVSAKSQEVWYYKKINKKFIFEIKDKGIFELISIEG
ncbi:MAG TPA: GWxTD domain-containing protein [Candidatus Kapabacteria bacterium]|nr:GWxTD domain-containing protein [Candidatus Kapabacteria bacterium]